MSKVYLVPGLGTDVRIFSKLIPLLNEKEVVCLEYLEPVNLQESIPEYAKRLVERLPKGDPPPVLIGMSLGGTVVTEMAKLIPHEALVVISSYKHRSEVPFLFKMARVLPLHVLVPAWYIRIVVPILARILGICNKEDAKVIKAMLCDRSNSHFAWGRRAIVKWDNQAYPQHFIHINGTKDHLFRGAEKQVTHKIIGGTHNMVMDRAAEIATILNEEIFV